MLPPVQDGRIADGKAVAHAGVVSGKAYDTTEKWV